MELHHIIAVADGGTDDLDNCIALCFDCHAEVRAYDPKHPKGHRFTASELRRHRDIWYSKVATTGGMKIDDPRYEEPDRALYREMMERIPPDCRIVRLLSHPNIAYMAFKGDLFEQVDDFLDWAQRPDREFLDADLEHLRSEFVGLLDEYVMCLGKNTYTLDHGTELRKVPDEWEYTQSERYNNAVEALGAYQQRFEELYVSLIRTCRRKLAV